MYYSGLGQGEEAKKEAATVKMTWQEAITNVGKSVERGITAYSDAQAKARLAKGTVPSTQVPDQAVNQGDYRSRYPAQSSAGPNVMSVATPQNMLLIGGAILALGVLVVLSRR